MICPTLQREVDTQECRNNKIRGFDGCSRCEAGKSQTAKSAPEPRKIKEEPQKMSVFIDGNCAKCGKHGKVFRKSIVCMACARADTKPAKKAPEADANFRAASIGVSVSSDQVPFVLPLLEKEPKLMNALAEMAKRDRRTLEQQILWLCDRAVDLGL